MIESRNCPFWKSSLPKLAGGCWPLSLASSGFGSNVSTWLGPPCMNREITLFAVARKGGTFGASGPGAAAVLAAAAVRLNMSRAASQPMPRPDACRNLRRESSIDINKLAHIEYQKAQPRQRVPAQVIERGPAFFGGRGMPKCQPPPSLYRSFRIIAGLLLDTRGELLCLRRSRLTIHQ